MNFRCASKPIKQLNKSFHDIRQELGDDIPADWTVDNPIQHFGSQQAVFQLYQLNKNGCAIKDQFMHRNDPQWRMHALLACDEMLHGKRATTRVRKAPDSRTKRYKERKQNVYDMRLTATEVSQCIAMADTQSNFTRSKFLPLPRCPHTRWWNIIRLWQTATTPFFFTNPPRKE